MKRSLLFKFILCYIILVSIIYAVINTIGAAKISSSLEEYFTTSMNSCSLSLNNSTEISDYFKGNSSTEELSSYIKTVSEYVIPRIFILNEYGTILVDSNNSVKTSDHINMTQYDSTILKNTAPFRASYANLLPENSLYTITKVAANSSTSGYILLCVSDEVISSRYSQYLGLANIYVLLTLPIIAGVFILIYFLTIAPVNRITKYAVACTSGQFDYKLVIKSNDEYKQLADAVQYMVGELNNLDEYQRKFIGNISHDFRSPLTSIKGYVEAMLDGTIPVDNQKKYLNIILFEAERLTNLTTNLLTLNKFDNNKRILEKKIFDINYILSKTGEVYEGRCSKNKIEIVTNFESPTQFVYADQSQIQQVINNIVDNAIKFSPQYSQIILSTFVRNEKVFVSIKDSGAGIPKSSINRIWERFYKTDPSRGKDKKGTGLGLAITKEIINAHHENINVISTEGVGTEFIFTLTKSTPPNL